MLNGISDSIKRKNAEFIRDVEYIKEMAYEDALDDRLSCCTDDTPNLSMSSISDDVKFIDNLEETPEESEAEVQRIMNTDRNLTFNDMIGLTKPTDVEEDGMEGDMFF